MPALHVEVSHVTSYIYCFIPRYPNEPFLFFFLFPTNFDPMEYSTKKNGKTEDGGNPGIFITRQTDR